MSEITVHFDPVTGYIVTVDELEEELPPDTSPEQLTAAIHDMMGPTARIGAWFKRWAPKR